MNPKITETAVGKLRLTTADVKDQSLSKKAVKMAEGRCALSQGG